MSQKTLLHAARALINWATMVLGRYAQLSNRATDAPRCTLRIAWWIRGTAVAFVLCIPASLGGPSERSLRIMAFKLQAHWERTRHVLCI